jgi:hypothetical protein
MPGEMTGPPGMAAPPAALPPSLPI